MRIVTFAGPPSSGKTSVLLRLIPHLRNLGTTPGVAKFDCLSSHDAELYAAAGVPAITGLSGNFCPDHFFITNIEECAAWAERNGTDLLLCESAGLCNRCAPHLRGFLAVCVLDNLSGIGTPRKIGPMLKTADIVVVTKGDIVSQAEREVFEFRVSEVNPKARVLFTNGITGQGAWELAQVISECSSDATLSGGRLRFSVPAAVCSYCLGETKIGEDYQRGTVRKMDFPVEAA